MPPLVDLVAALAASIKAALDPQKPSQEIAALPPAADARTLIEADCLGDDQGAAALVPDDRHRDQTRSYVVDMRDPNFVPDPEDPAEPADELVAETDDSTAPIKTPAPTPAPAPRKTINYV